MALYLNTNAACKDFQMLSGDKYFVDKSAFIEKVNERVKTKNRFLCVTKPRRFGKTSVLNMLGAYYGKAYPSKEMFDDLKISGSQSFEAYLNQYNIISFSLNELPGRGNTFQDYIGRFETNLRNDIREAYPELNNKEFDSLSCVVTLAYLSARNKYKVEREEKSGKGFADFIFYPRRKNLPGIVIELKADSTPEAAIKQIKDKEYGEKLLKEGVENILLVGISYDTAVKQHQCRIEKADGSSGAVEGTR